METNIQEAKLKNGKRAGFVKIDDKAVFIQNRLTLWQIALLAFILASSIIMNVIILQFVADGFNEILGDLNQIKINMGIEGHIVYDPSNPNYYDERIEIP